VFIKASENSRIKIFSNLKNLFASTMKIGLVMDDGMKDIATTLMAKDTFESLKKAPMLSEKRKSRKKSMIPLNRLVQKRVGYPSLNSPLYAVKAVVNPVKVSISKS
jgi:hypothetical protein